MKKRVLITGGNGFIGSELVKTLSQRDLDLTVLDLNLPENEVVGVNYITGNVRNNRLLENIIPDSDLVVNMASQLGIKFGIDFPLTQLENNFFSCYSLLELCSKNRVKFVHASSSAIYGKPVQEELFEDSDIILGNLNTNSWNYAFSKISQEYLVRAYSLERGLPTQIIRYFNCIGKDQKPDLGHVLPKFIEAALNNRPLQVHGSGHQERSYMHVDDAVNATCLILDNFENGAVYNVGGKESISVIKLAHMVIEMSKSNSVIEYVDPEKIFSVKHQEPIKRNPNTNKILDLGFEQKYSLEKAINEVIEYHRQTPEILVV